MTFAQIVDEYLVKISQEYQEAIRSGEATPELSYRPVLDEFLVKIASFFGDEIYRTFEPRNQANSGRPDWRFYNTQTLGVYGYIEGKGLNPSTTIDDSDHGAQINKYLKLGQKVILTDGLDFILHSPSEDTPRRFNLINKPSGQPFTTGENALLSEQHFRFFFSAASSRSINEDQLVAESAKRAAVLALGIEELSSLPSGAGVNETENQTIEIIKDIQQTVKAHHDPRLEEPKVFSAFVAQVLIFGLIYAHRIVFNRDDTPQERYEKLRDFWESSLQSTYTDHLRPFKALAKLLRDELSSLGLIGTWYEDCCLLLAHVNLSNQQTNNPDYHILFEKFLESFDPSTRFDFGAFYTPLKLSKYSLDLTEKITSEILPGVNLFDNSHKLIDPCCGTGSFLEQLILKSRERNSNPEIIGFEILPTPYALTHYRMSLIDSRYPENVEVILTNTLSDDLENDEGGSDLGLLEDEQRVARETSTTPLTLIIGNPPSTDSSSHTTGDNFEIIKRLVNDFRPPEDDRTSRQNTQKQLQNDFIKFLRWSCEKIIKSNKGVVSLILPSSFAEHSSYRYARKWLSQKFNSIWILELDQDARTGVRASSIFNTLQGRLLLVATYDSSVVNGTQTVRYLDISSKSKVEKINFLSQDEIQTDDFEQVEIDASNCNFRPRAQFDESTYEKFWSLYPQNDQSEDYIFNRHCSGIKLAPSSLLVHVKKPLLVRRSQDISNLSQSSEDIISKWYQGQDRPPNRNKFTTEVRSSIGHVLQDDQNIVRYSYRPFLPVWATINEEVLRNLSLTPGGGTRYRPEVISAYKASGTIGIAVAPSTRDIGENLHRFTSFCWSLPDNDLCKRGNAHIFSNVYPEYKRRSTWNPAPINNINEDLMERLGTTDQEVVFYVYGILCSDTFLDRFEGALYSVSGSDNMPRIPFPNDRSQFLEISNLGKKLALLEKPQEEQEITLDDFHNNLLQLFNREFNLTSFKINEEDLEITLCGESNNFVVLRPIKQEVLKFSVAGYNVIQQWLKLYSFRYSRSTFTSNDFSSFVKLLQTLKSQISIVNELDALVDVILDNTESLTTP